MSIEFLKENCLTRPWAKCLCGEAVWGLWLSCGKNIEVNGVSIVCEKIAYEGRALQNRPASGGSNKKEG